MNRRSAISMGLLLVGSARSVTCPQPTAPMTKSQNISQLGFATLQKSADVLANERPTCVCPTTSPTLSFYRLELAAE